jgi:hypothetical protein
MHAQDKVVAITEADLVGTVMRRVSDASGVVTGQTLAVDGGTVML